MKQITLKPILQSLAIILTFFITVVVYFSPLLDGKSLQQHDVVQYVGMSKELNDYREQTGEEALWTNSMFSGMPGYLISTTYDNLISTVHTVFNIDKDHPQMIAFMYFLCFFIALLMLDINIWLAMLGAFFYGFSSYFFIILEAGHITKAIALAYMPVIITSVYATYKGKHILGAAVFSLFLGLQIMINHLQITYYTAIIIFIFLCFYIYEVAKKGDWIKNFIKPSLFLLVAATIGVCANFGSLYLTYDYGKDSMRGKSELTSNLEDKTTGLDKSYATSYSYSKSETFDLLIPNFKGGSSVGNLDENSYMYKAILNQGATKKQARDYTQNVPLYWGGQPSTSGPVYIGAIVIFLFVFGLFIIQGTVKWWLLTATAFGIMIAWGSNFMVLVEPMLDYFPGFNKFRTISMILVIPQFTMPIMAVLALKEFFFNQEKRPEYLKKLLYALYVTGGLILLLIITAGSHDYIGSVDAQLKGNWPDWLLDALREDRKSLLIKDGWRSLSFVVITTGILYYFYKKPQSFIVTILALCLLVFADLWSVNKRYLNNDDFKRNSKNSGIQKTAADEIILQDKDPNFRVMNLTVSPFNDATTSYFHKSIGGYHGAKMKRYQELIDRHISKMNMEVFNMLNTKYFIVQNRETGEIGAQLNQEALGNAWFISDIDVVPNADAELAALTNFNPREKLIVDARFANQFTDTVYSVNNASITLNSYAPNELHYTSNNSQNGVAVFSEIYYNKGWNAYIDGTLQNHFRANYVLRALSIPAGEHEIVFKFEPKMYTIGNRISFTASLILVLLLLAAIAFEVKKSLATTKE